jgi:hypothetical protein
MTFLQKGSSDVHHVHLAFIRILEPKVYIGRWGTLLPAVPRHFPALPRHFPAMPRQFSAAPRRFPALLPCPTLHGHWLPEFNPRFRVAGGLAASSSSSSVHLAKH